MASRKKEDSPGYATSGATKLMTPDPFRSAMQDLQSNIIKQVSEQIKDLKVVVEGIDQKVKNVDEKLVSFNQAVEKVECRLDKAEQDIVDIKTEKEEMQSRLLALEMEKASYFLRIQNVEETPGETPQQLITLISEELAEQIEMTTEEIQNSIEHISRQANRYTRENKLPNEIHIKFMRRIVKERILKTNKEKDLTIKGTKINVMKQVPWSMRKKRQEYHFITKILIDRKIPFSWQTPEGIYLTWETRRYNLNSKRKARSFLMEMKQKLKLTEEESWWMTEDSEVEKEEEGARPKMSPVAKRTRSKEQKDKTGSKEHADGGTN